MRSIFNRLKAASSNPQLLLIIFFAFFVNGLMSTMLGALLPFMKREYNLNYTLTGIALSAHQVGVLIAVLAAGFLPYLIGRKKAAVLLGSGMWGGIFLLTCTGWPPAVLLSFVLAGVGRGMTSNISNVVVSEIAVNKTSLLNILHAVFAVGAFLSPFIVLGYTGPAGMSWRLPAWTLGILGLLMTAVLSRSSLSDCPSSRTFQSDAAFFRSAQFWLVTGILFFYLCSETTILGWLVTYFTESGIMPVGLAQTASSLLWIMVMGGRILCAAFSGRVKKQKLIIFLVACKSACLIVMLSSRNINVIFPALMGLGVSMAGIYPTTFSCMDSRYTSSTLATGTCIAIATVGGIVMPAVVGSVAERTSIHVGMLMLVFVLVFLFLLTVLHALYQKKRAVL